MPNRIEISPIKLQEYAQMYLAGATFPALAMEAGCSVPTIIRKLVTVGVKARKPGRRLGTKKSVV